MLLEILYVLWSSFDAIKYPKHATSTPLLYKLQITEYSRIKSSTENIDDPLLIPVFEEGLENIPDNFSWHDYLPRTILSQASLRTSQFPLSVESVSIWNAFDVINANLGIRLVNLSSEADNLHVNDYLTRYTNQVTNAIKSLHEPAYRQLQLLTSMLCMHVYVFFLNRHILLYLFFT